MSIIRTNAIMTDIVFIWNLQLGGKSTFAGYPFLKPERPCLDLRHQEIRFVIETIVCATNNILSEVKRIVFVSDAILFDPNSLVDIAE